MKQMKQMCVRSMAWTAAAVIGLLVIIGLSAFLRQPHSFRVTSLSVDLVSTEGGDVVVSQADEPVIIGLMFPDGVTPDYDPSIWTWEGDVLRYEAVLQPGERSPVIPEGSSVIRTRRVDGDGWLEYDANPE